MSLPLQLCHGPIDNSVMSLNVWVSRLPVFIPPNLKAFLIRYLIHWFDPMVLTRSSRDQNTSNQGSAQVISSNQGSLDCFLRRPLLVKSWMFITVIMIVFSDWIKFNTALKVSQSWLNSNPVSDPCTDTIWTLEAWMIYLCIYLILNKWLNKYEEGRTSPLSPAAPVWYYSHTFVMLPFNDRAFLIE